MSCWNTWWLLLKITGCTAYHQLFPFYLLHFTTGLLLHCTIHVCPVAGAVWPVPSPNLLLLYMPDITPTPSDPKLGNRRWVQVDPREPWEVRWCGGCLRRASLNTAGGSTYPTLSCVTQDRLWIMDITSRHVTLLLFSGIISRVNLPHGVISSEVHAGWALSLTLIVFQTIITGFKETQEVQDTYYTIICNQWELQGKTHLLSPYW